MIVTNYSNVLSTFKARPYEIWSDTDLSEDEVREFVEAKFENTTRKLKNIHSYRRKQLW